MVSWWHARRLHSSAMPLTLRPAALGQLCSDGNSCRGSGGPAGALRKRSLHWNFSWRAASPWAITVQHRLCTWQPWTPRRLHPAQATFTSTWFCRITISFCFLPLSCRIPPVCSSIYFFIFFFVGLVICLVFLFSGTRQRGAPCLAEMCWLVLLWWDSPQLRHHFSLAPWLLLPARLSPPGVSVWNGHTLWQGESRLIFLNSLVWRLLCTTTLERYLTVIPF